MKKTLLLLSALLVSFGAMAQDVTLDFTTNSWGLPEGSSAGATEEASFTSGDYTIKVSATSKYYFNTEGYLMIGKKGSKLTLPTFAQAVEKIEVVGRTGASAKTTQNIYVGEEAVSTETTGSTSTQTYEIADAYQAAGTEYVFTVTNAYNAQVTTINVYFKNADAKKSAGLAWSAAKTSLEQGADFTAPTLTKATTATVTFATDNEAVATVDAEGNIALAGALGTATITASSEENDEYEAGTATTIIEVYSYNHYVKATELVSGNKYLLVAQRGDSITAYGYPLGETYTFGYMNTNKLDGIKDTISIKTTYDDTFTFTQAEEGTYYIQDCYGRYYYNDGEHNSFQLSTDEDPDYAWALEAQEDGTYKLTNNGRILQWGSGTYTNFAGYDTMQENAVLPCLYELAKEEDTVEPIIFAQDWTADGTGFTFVSDIDWDKQYVYVNCDVDTQNSANIISIGAEGTSSVWNYAIHSYWTENSNGGQTNWYPSVCERQNDTSYAGGTTVFTLTKAEGYARDGIVKFPASDIDDMYALSRIELSDMEGSVRSSYHYNYIAILPIGYVPPTTPTAIDAVKTVETNANAPMYNLAGQRVGADYKGIVIQNGRKSLKK